MCELWHPSCWWYFNRIENLKCTGLEYSTDHNEILHTSQQLHYRDMCKFSLSLAKYDMNKTITKFHWISNLIKISVGRVPGVSIVNTWKKIPCIKMKFDRID